MSRYLAMALIASCGLPQGAMAANRVLTTPTGIAATMAPELYGPASGLEPMKCDQTSFTIAIPPAAPDKNGQPKWLRLVRVVGPVIEWHVLSGAETSFTRSGLKRASIYLFRARQKADGNYEYVAYPLTKSYSYNNVSNPIACITK